MKSKALLFLAFLAVTLLPTIGMASDGEQASTSARRLWEELNLTPDQEAKFRDINAKHAPARRDHARRLEEVRARMNQELLKDRPSRSLLAQYAGQMGEFQKQMNIASVNHMLDVKAVLTAEQFNTFLSRASIGGSGGTRRQSGEN